MTSENEPALPITIVPRPDCSTCFFFSKQSEDKHGLYGTCHRLPPTLSPLSQKEAQYFEYDDKGSFQGRYELSFVHWVQPAVTDDDWCGEYRDRSPGQDT